MKRFLRQHEDQISGVLSGFDRLRFRGTLRWLAYTADMRSFLSCVGVLLKDFKTYVQGGTDHIRDATEQVARAAGRQVIYLNSSAISKEEMARDIAERDGIGPQQRRLSAADRHVATRVARFQMHRVHIEVALPERRPTVGCVAGIEGRVE